MNDRTEIFLDEYKKLESIAIQRYGFPDDGTAIAKLEQESEFRHIKAEIKYCREVRRLLSHNPKVKDDYAVDPSEQMIALLRETIEKIQNPPKAFHVAIPKASLLYKTLDDYVRPAMTEMLQKSYTYIPILKDGVLVGVFSENTILSYLVDEEIIGIDNSTRFSDLQKYLPIDMHTSEVFEFSTPNDTLMEIKQKFEKQRKRKQERLGMIFLTQNGRKTEKILGIITAWDIAGE